MNTGDYTMLEIFAEALQSGGKIRLLSGGGRQQEVFAKSRNLSTLKQSSVPENCQEIPVESGYYRWLRIPVEQETEYEILCEGCRVSLCYLSGCEHILETGVCYLEQEKENGKIGRASWRERVSA